jgi:hypothetical protein
MNAAAIRKTGKQLLDSELLDMLTGERTNDREHYQYRMKALREMFSNIGLAYATLAVAAYQRSGQHIDLDIPHSDDKRLLQAIDFLETERNALGELSWHMQVALMERFGERVERGEFRPEELLVLAESAGLSDRSEGYGVTHRSFTFRFRTSWINDFPTPEDNEAPQAPSSDPSIENEWGDKS